jgi:MFS family permease
MALPAIIRALRNSNYRLYFGGQLVSLIGTWMQQVAMSWLVYRLTGSVLLLGVVAFCGQIPVLLLAPFGGLWSDRRDRRLILIATQAASLVQALALAALTLSRVVQPWHLVALALALGVINAVDIPARQAFVVRLVDRRDDLPNAIALNSFAMNAARLVGPAVAGVLVSLVGEGMCFLLNAASYLTVLLALTAIRSGHDTRPAQSARHALGEGFAYAFSRGPIRGLLLLVAVISLSATPYTVLMPVYAKEIFGGDARLLGLLLGCAGGGALVGTVVLAARKTLAGLENVIALAPLLAGAGLMILALSVQPWQAMPALALVGFGVISSVASANTMIQALVADELRGRVMSIFTMAFLGLAPLGSLAAGSLAHVVGAPTALFVGGACSLAAGLLFARKRRALGAAAGVGYTASEGPSG